MKQISDGVLTLFSGLNSSSSSSSNIFNSINLSDYASIKSGTYGKLMKSYYKSTSAKADSSDTSNTTNTTNSKTKLAETGLSTMKKDADALKTATEKLQASSLWTQSAGSYDTQKITDAVKSFATSYNDTLTQSANISSKEISQTMNYMKSMTSTMSKALSKVGITVGTDGKLAVDAEALKSANVSSIKSLFGNAGSYGSQIENYASDISKDALMNSSIYNSDGTTTSSISELFNTIV